MQTFDQALFQLYEDGIISYEEAMRNADSKNELQAPDQAAEQARRRRRRRSRARACSWPEKRKKAGSKSFGPRAAACSDERQAAVQADGRQEGVGPLLHHLFARHDQDRRQDHARQSGRAHAEDGSASGARAHERAAARAVHERSRDRLRDLGGRARPIPRQRLPPARQRRDGAPLHHAGVAAARSARHARDPERHDHAAARLDLDGRRQRLGQVDDAGGDDRLSQQELGVAHRDDRGSDRVPAQQSEVDRQPARGRSRHACRITALCAARCARRRTSS